MIIEWDRIPNGHEAIVGEPTVPHKSFGFERSLTDTVTMFEKVLVSVKCSALHVRIFLSSARRFQAGNFLSIW